MSKFLTIVLALFHLCASAQYDKYAEKIVSNTKKLVQKLDKDRNLEEVRAYGRKDSVSMVSSDTLPSNRVIPALSSIFTDTMFSAYYRDNKLQKVTSFLQDHAFGGIVKDFYFEDERLVCVVTKHTNAVYMGSCGAVTFERRYYFMSNTVIKMETKLPDMFPMPRCYQRNDIETETTIFKELENILTRFEPGNVHRQ